MPSLPLKVKWNIQLKWGHKNKEDEEGRQVTARHWTDMPESQSRCYTNSTACQERNSTLEVYITCKTAGQSSYKPGDRV